MLRDLIGTPYTTAHCWGLVCLAYRQRGIDLPAFDDVGAADLRAVARTIAPNAERGPWRRVRGAWNPAAASWRPDDVTCAWRPYDVVLMFGRVEPSAAQRAIIHCGLVVDPNYILHTERETDAVLARRDSNSVRHRIAAVYRHHDV